MIGERLKYYRNQRGMTQEEVAEKMAVDTGVIDCWEKNILAPTPKELVSIVKILGVTAGKILDKNIVSEKDEDVLPKEQYYFEHVIGDEEKIRKEDASRFVKRVGIVYLALILIFCVIALICFVLRCKRSARLWVKGSDFICDFLYLLCFCSQLSGYYSKPV